jgi:hypothetical protein
MAIKFNHVTNTISFTSGACSISFVDSSATGIFETTGYARNCYVTTGQTGNFVTASQTGCFITTGQTGAFGGGGGGTSLPNGTTENSALCWNGSAWVAAETYVATGQTGDFSPYNLDFNNFNVAYKCNSNSISGSTGSAILEGACNRIVSSLYSQINNGCCNCIAATGATGLCHNYIENGFRNYIYNSNFSEILNGTCSIISGGASHSAIMNGSGNCIRGGTAMTIVNSMCSNICGGGTFSAVILGGCTNVINSASRSSIIGGNANIICSASVDAVINGGRSHCIIGASMSTIVGGNSNRIIHIGAIAQTGNVIIGGEQSRICGCINTNCNTIINSFSGCIVSGSFNTLINGTNSCLINGASSSLVIGPRNVISGFTGAVVIGSGITANASNTLFVSNLRSTGIISGNICGTGNFVTTSQTGCFITTGQTGAFGGGGGTTLPNGSSTNSALCWNGSAWVAAQTYVATGQTGNFVTTSQTGCFITTGQTGAFGGSSGGGINTGSGYLSVNSVIESFTPLNIINSSPITFDVIPNSTLYYTGNTINDFTINLRGSSSCTLNSLLPLNNSLSVSLVHNLGAAPYSLTGVSIDGTARSVRWAGGGAAPTGVTNAINVYSINVFKTGNNLFSVLGSLGFFS